MVNISPQLNINFFEGVKNNSWINIEVPKSDSGYSNLCISKGVLWMKRKKC